jgi:hypothetical protein
LPLKPFGTKHFHSIYEINCLDHNYICSQCFNKKDLPVFGDLIDEIEQEEIQRLNYVAITRAKYAFYGISQEELEGTESFIIDDAFTTL